MLDLTLPRYGISSNNRGNTKYVGMISELTVMLRFAELGYRVSAPFGEHAPYDAIVETPDAVFSEFKWRLGHRNSPPSRYRGKIGAFAIFCPHNGECYVVGVDDPCVRGDHGYLRTSPARNNMKRGIHWASRYALDKETGPKLFELEPAESGALDED